MKKVVLVTALLVFSFAAAAQAESLEMGGKTITYDIPDGYVHATGGKYDLVLGAIRKVMPKEIAVHAMYVPEEVDKRFLQNDDADMNRYLLVTYHRGFKDKNVSTGDFKGLKEHIVKNQGTLVNDTLRDTVNKNLSKLTGGQMRVGSVKSLGAFGATDTQVSFMALVTSAVQVNGRRVPVEQVMVTTQLLTQGRLLIINQYAPAEDPESIAAFRDQSLAVLKSMDFKEGGSWFGSAFKKESTVWDYMKTGFLGALGGGVIGGVILFIKRRRKGGSDNRTDVKTDLKGLAEDAQKNIRNMLQKNKK